MPSSRLRAFVVTKNMRWWAYISILISFVFGASGYGYAENFEGQIVKDVQVTCLAVPELVNLIRKNIAIHPGDVYSQQTIRTSIRQIYALKRFSQITVEGEMVEGGVRLSFCPLQIKTISKIQVTGNQTIPTDRIVRVMELRIGEQVPTDGMNDMRQRILDLYRRQGYYQVKIDIQTISEAGNDKESLMVAIQEGEPGRIGTIIFSGQAVFDQATLLKTSQLKSEMKFTLDGVGQGIERIKQLYSHRGYFDVTFTETNLKYNDAADRVDVQLTLSEGNPTTIRFEGNVHVKTKKLDSLIDIRTSKDLQEESLAEKAAAVTEYYRGQGFFFGDVTLHTTADAKGKMITFSINEGPRVLVQNILMEGNQAFSAKTLRKQMLTTTGGLFSKGYYRDKVFQEDILALKAFYRQQGYLEADVISIRRDFSLDRQQVALAFVIHEGVQTHVGDLRIVGEIEEAPLKKIRKRLLLKTGEPFNIDLVATSIDGIKDFYANQGYIQAAVDIVPVFNNDNSQASLTFTITPGQKFYIGKISIQGVIRTKKQFITRELKVKEGDVYNPQKIRETVRRLNQLGFYDSVTFRRLDPKSDQPVQDMLLAVTETSAKDVAFRFGYSTETALRAVAEYSDRNVLNHGGQGTASLELSIERPKLILQYQHPHLFTQNTQLILAVFDDIQKDNENFEVENRGGRLGIRHQFDKTLAASVGYYFLQADPSNVNETAIVSELDTKVLNWGGLDAYLSWDFRDDIIQTRKGGFNQLALRTANRALGAEADFLEITAQSNWYLNPLRDYVLACSVVGKLIKPLGSTEAIPIYARYFLGGDNSVRGFERYSIGPAALNDKGKLITLGGDRMFRLNAELRFPIYGVLGGVIFYDTGANWLAEDGFETDDIREAIGAGLRVKTPVGPFRIDYGWKLDRRPDESAGEYYITIGSAF